MLMRPLGTKAPRLPAISLLLGLSALLVGAGLLVSPATVAERISPDGVFGDGVLDRMALLSFCRWGSVAAGILLLLCGVAKLTANRRVLTMEAALEERTLSYLRRPRLLIVFVFAFLGLVLLNETLHFAASRKWKDVTGYEYYWIAESLTEGHGYSLAENHRWYFDDFKTVYPPDRFHPTALEEPVYPFLLAFSFKHFGERGRLYVLLLNVVMLYLTAVLVYLLAKKVFGSRLGVLGSAALLTWWWFDISWLTIGVFSPAIIAGFNTVLSAYLILWFLEKISVGRGVVLGFVLAFSCLILAASQLFLPVAVLLAFVMKRPWRPLAWRPALAIVLTSCAVFAPWAIRNYMVFETFVPIRTGFGLALHQSNPALAASYSDVGHTCVKELGPMWKASGPKDAIQKVRSDKALRMEMYRRSYECIELEEPGHYAEFNEPQRDKIYLEKSVEFARDNPGMFLALTRYRIQSFLVGWSSRHTLVTVLAIIGTLVAWRNVKAWILLLLVAAYVFPFSLATPLMYRYRYPVEPILFVLACGIPALLQSLGGELLARMLPREATGK